MKSIFISSSLIGILFLVAGCGKDEPASTGYTLSGNAYTIVAGSNLTAQSGGGVSGTGSILFTPPLAGGLDAKTEFKITFSLQDGGSLDLVVNSQSDLSQGSVVRFSRSGAVLSVGAAGKRLTALAGVDATAPVSLQVDVHNDEGHAIISNSRSVRLLNLPPNRPESVTKGRGSRYGVILNKATLTSLERSVSKIED